MKHSKNNENMDWNDEKLWRAIKEKTKDVEMAMEYIYRKYGPTVRNFLKKLGGTDEDIASAFIPGMVNFEGRLCSDKFQLQESIESLFLSAITDAWVMEGLRQEETSGHRIAAFNFVYPQWLDLAHFVVRDLGGEALEAEAAFDEAFTGVYNWVCKPESTLYQAALKTYFSRAVKRAWYKVKAQKLSIGRLPEEETPAQEEEPLINNYSLTDAFEEKILQQAKNKLPEKCRKIVDLVLKNRDVTNSEIATAMGYSTTDTAKNKKSACWNDFLNLLPPELQAKNKLNKGRPGKKGGDNE